MARSKKSQYTEKDTRVIYILLNPLSKEFYIGHCKETSLKHIFQKHYYGERYQTKESVNSLKNQKLHPCLFVLEKLYSTKVEAYNYVIVWTKIFIENGYKNLDTGNILNYINELFKNNLLLYNQHNTLDIKKIIQCKNCVVSNYNRKKCPLFKP